MAAPCFFFLGCRWACRPGSHHTINEQYQITCPAPTASNSFWSHPCHSRIIGRSSIQSEKVKSALSEWVSSLSLVGNLGGIFWQCLKHNWCFRHLIMSRIYIFFAVLKQPLLTYLFYLNFCLPFLLQFFFLLLCILFFYSSLVTFRFSSKFLPSKSKNFRKQTLFYLYIYIHLWSMYLHIDNY